MKPRDRFCTVLRGFAGVLAGALLWLAVCASGQAQLPFSAPRNGTLIAEVKLEGLARISEQSVRSKIDTRPGQEYQQDKIRADVDRLCKTGFFAPGGVTTQWEYTPDNKVIVYFIFRELAGRIESVHYLGLKHLKVDDVNSLIAPLGVRKGAPMNPNANKMAVDYIRRRYHEKGYTLATVELLEGNSSSDSRVVFSITEGSVLKVRDIVINGHSFVSGARLRTQIASSTPWFPFVLDIGGDYSPEMAAADEQKLTAYYRAFGYHDVRVQHEVQYDPDMRNVVLHFHIYEGDRYKIARTELTGVTAVPREDIESLIRIKPGEVYDQFKIERDKKAIEDWYGYQGRQVKVIAPEPGLPPPVTSPGNVVVRYEIQERPPARVGAITIVGNEVTDQRIILNQLLVRPGQILRYPDLRLSEQRLAKLGIFETNAEGVRPTITVIDPDGPNPFKELLVTVQETRTGSFMIGAGVTSDAGVIGSVVLNERNFDITRLPYSWEDLLSGHAFRGGAQELRIEAQPGTQIQRYAVTWRDPFFLDSPYSVSWSGYYYTRIYNEDHETRLGTRIGVSRRLNDAWTANLTMRVENVGISDVVPWAPEDYLSVVGHNFLLGGRIGVTRDVRNSFLRPSEGSKFELSFEQVTGEFTFPLINADFQKYWTVYQRPDGSGRHVLAFRSQLGWAGANAPVYERFFDGGNRTIRGFQFRGVGPSINGFQVGGDFLWNNSLEYQIPLKANDQIYLVAFVDSGTVESQMEIKDYRVTAGLGLRFVVPMLGPVPIALDFGFPIVKGPTDREQVFSFYIGTSW